MEAAIDQVRSLYANANARERQQIQEQLRDLQRDLYTDWELLFGFATGNLHWALIRIALDLSLFTTLAASPTPLTHATLVQHTGAAPTLLRHLLCALASFGFIQETAKDTFTATRTTRVFASPNFIGAEPHLTDIHLPVSQVLPTYLKERKYQDITDPKDLPFHQALHTELTPFEWMKREPGQMKALGHIMVLDAVQSWAESAPVEKWIESFIANDETALLVDVGGGFGQHSVFFRQKYPHIPGRVVVQDVASTLAHAPKVEGIEFVVHDFFTEQPVRGAKFYYLRHILHDWADADCIRILKNLVPALGAESLIVIDEVVLPETNLPWQAAMMDIAIMASLGGIERSREDWEDLLGRAGLKMVDVHRYDEVKLHSVITAVPK